MLATLLKNIISISIGAAVLIIVLFYYNTVEKFFKTKFNKRLDWMRDKLDKMFLKALVSEQKLFFITFGPFFSGILVSILLGILVQDIVAALIILVIFGSIGFFLPQGVVFFMYYKRMRTFNDQLIDALSMIGNALRSGLSLLQGVHVVVENMKNPISQEFALMLSEHKMGVSFDDALVNMSNRIPSEDLFMAVNSIVTLRETGGDLSEVFDTMELTIRERRKIEGKIRSLTAMGIMQGGMLISFPFVLAFFFYLSDPATMKLFVTTNVGWALILIILVLQGIGAYIIKKIVTIKV